MVSVICSLLLFACHICDCVIAIFTDVTCIWLFTPEGLAGALYRIFIKYISGYGMVCDYIGHQKHKVTQPKL